MAERSRTHLVLIPSYNPGKLVYETVRAAREHWSPVWIVVDGSWQGRGVGSALVGEMERQLAGSARLIVVETAGRDDYAPTRAFYEARGYHVGATIADYYADGDDLVTYVKQLGGRR